MADNEIVNSSSGAASKKAVTPASRKEKTTRDQMRYLTHEAILEEVAPSKLNLVAIVLIVGLLSAALVWSSMVTVQTSASASGEVMPSGEERVVQHLEGGIVSSLNVHDGDLVGEGDTLLRLDKTARLAELDQVRARAASLRIRERRLRALLDGTVPEFGILESKYPAQVAGALFALEATRNRLEGQRAVIESRIKQRQKSVDIYTKQVSSLQDQIGLVQETVDMRGELFESGHGSRVNLIGAQLELSRVQGALTETIVSADQARAAIQESVNEINELEVTERSQALDELSQVIAELAEVDQNRARLRDRVNRLAITSPANGIVHGLTVNTPGAVVAPGQVILTIVPIDGEVVAEVKIDPKDIGHLATGQQAKINISGFDARRYGTVLGRLIRVSPTSDTASDGTTYFLGRIVLDNSEIEGTDATHQVTPGMVIQADVVTGSQTLLQYLTGPLYSAVSAAFTER